MHKHQEEAIRIAQRNQSYVLTTGTGSGKSLSYFIPIVDHVLRNHKPHVSAIVIYPMNALANSPCEELARFLKLGYPNGNGPVTLYSMNSIPIKAVRGPMSRCWCRIESRPALC
ncbi:DEAD/DEAH box helicase [Methylothermus subterraneus]